MQAVAYDRGVRQLLLVVSLVAAGCRPEPVLNPHKTPTRQVNPEVERDLENAEAPEGTVQNGSGVPVELASLWKDHRVVVVFYHGGWCPPCREQLTRLNEHMREIDGHVIAISADSPEAAKELHDKLGLVFELYADPTLATIQKWGVEDYGNNIAESATFVVEPGGKISYRKVGHGKSDHPSVDEVIAATKPAGG
jgi:peroxiredoxin